MVALNIFHLLKYVSHGSYASSHASPKGKRTVLLDRPNYLRNIAESEGIGVELYDVVSADILCNRQKSFPAASSGTLIRFNVIRRDYLRIRQVLVENLNICRRQSAVIENDYLPLSKVRI